MSLSRYRLSNMTVRISLPVEQNVTLEVWVDATTDAVRVSSNSDQPHKLRARLEVWRNVSGPYPFSGSWCASLHPNVTRSADIVSARADGGVLFYHRTPEDYVGMWETDLANQQMGTTALPNPLLGSTFGGLLSGTSGSDAAFIHSSSNKMSMVYSVAGMAHLVTISGTAGVYEDVADFLTELDTAAARPVNSSAHAAVWEDFWTSSDITITAAAKPNDTSVAQVR